MVLACRCRILAAALYAASALRRGVKTQDCFSDYDGKPLLEFNATSHDELAGFSTKTEDLGCAEVGAHRGIKLLAICSAEQTASLQSLYGDKIRVVVDDAGAHYRKSSGPAQGFTQRGDQAGISAVSTEFYTNWRNVEARIAQVETAVANSGGTATLYQIGSSVEGRPIMAVRLRGAGWTSGGPRIVVTCALHAREWITGMACVYAVEAAILKAKADPSWLAGTELAIAPMCNPDGSLYSETTSRMWRKNRAVNSGSSCMGVDLNRNWEPEWSGPLSTSSNPCSDLFYGPSAFSEPETQAVKGLIDESSVTIHLDIHSYGSVIMAPWGYSSSKHPRRAEIDVPGHMMRDAVRAKHREYFAYGGSEVLYPVSGCCPDYSTSTGAFGYTYELRPADAEDGGFAPWRDQILPSAEECFEGILAAITWSQNPTTPTTPTTTTTTEPPTNPPSCPWHGCIWGCSGYNCQACPRCQ